MKKKKGISIITIVGNEIIIYLFTCLILYFMEEYKFN